MLFCRPVRWARFAIPFAMALIALSLFPVDPVSGQPASKPAFEFRKGDRVSILGNTLADRMQHDGWLETYLYSRFPNQELAFRNLGFSADELTIRLRSAAFGSPDEWLKRTKTDVVFAFFGYNESFAGEAGLAKFKSDLENFIKNTKKQDYSGNGPARVVIFSPIAHENIHDRNVPDGKQNNERLAKYTAAMAAVAKANGAEFVDLFQASKKLYAENDRPLTINGIHLNELGNERIAKAIDQALFGDASNANRSTEHLEKIRQAVLDKNFFWYNRYRTVDGYSIFGGRADLKFVAGQTNRVVMQREMEVLDVMTANRDKRIWSVAQGKDMKVDDSNAPPFIPVVTNKPGPLPGGKHLFLDGTEAISKMTIGKGLKINLFASEKEFPDLVNPVQMSFDPQGRLWVAVWPTYPHWKPGEPMNDKILILEDTNGDGKADKLTTFADNLHCPTGFELWNGGVIVAQAPDLIFLKDTNGDGKADQRVRLVSGLDSADTHHAANSFVLDPGGALYFQEGTFHHTQVETPFGPPQRVANGAVFRYEPRAQKFEVYVSFGFANPHGHVFDRWGQDIVVDGTGAVPTHGALFSGQVDFPARHGGPPHVYKQKTRPCPGMEYLSSKHFPDEFEGNLLVANVIGFQGILRYKVFDNSASYGATELEPIVSSTDPNFRPSDLRMGPDGALYFIDWHNPIIGHMQHNLRDPSRDRDHGRVYRVTYEGRPLQKPEKIAGESLEKLLDLLKHPIDRIRYRTRIELTTHDSLKVAAALPKWIASLDAKDPEFEHHLTEALWLYQNHNVVNEEHLKRMLRSPDFRARAAATRVLCYWRDRVRNPIDLLQVQINDSHPRVRLEAIRALSFFHEEKALSVAMELFTHPDDEYLRYVFNETLNTLENRLRTGARVDRKNIAVSLLSMLEKGQVSPDRQTSLIETIVKVGTEKELRAIWQRVQAKDSMPEAQRKRVFEWLADAAITRRVQPKVDTGVVTKILSDASPAILPEAIRLAAAWKVKDSADTLRKIATDANRSSDVRFAAIDGLASLAGDKNRDTLTDLAGSATPLVVRFRAAQSLAQLDLKSGADAAAKALATAGEKDDPSVLIEAFLTQKKGSDQLAASLEGQKIQPDTAKRILRAMYLSGRNDAALGNVAAKFAGIDAAPKPPTPAEVAEIGKEVMAQGDASRGEKVFRRMDLGCVKCHSLNKAGGNIGPDLAPIGGSSPLDYIVSSILDPNASIKEEYLTKVIATTTGKIVTGVVAERSKNHVVLKDATGKLVRIPAAEIDEEAAGKSLMPEGITRILTKGELLDLIRFVSELGKPGDYSPRKTTTVQRWKRLKEVTVALADGVPNREVIRESILRAAAEAWEPVFAQYNGKLPLADLQKPGPNGVVYLQGEINVIQAGAIEFVVNSDRPVQYWINEDGFEKTGSNVVQLPTGRHRITVRVDAGSTPSGNLSVELRKPADSRGHYEIVHAE